MIVGTRDRTYGGAGAMWSLMPSEYQLWDTGLFADPDKIETHFVGGRAVGLYILPVRSPCLVVQGWSYSPPTLGDARRTVSVARSLTAEGDLVQGMRTMVISDASRDSDALATCETSPNQFAVLIRAAPANRLPGPSEYSLLTVDGTSQVAVVTVTSRSISPAWLRDGAGGMRIAAGGGAIAIASASGTQLRLTILPSASPPIVRDIALGAAGGQLPGLTGLAVASLRFTGSGLSVALTADQVLPGPGGVSRGVLLRLRADGTRDPAFGEDGDGLWVSPVDPRHRTFRCAGETANGVGGSEGGRAVLYGIVADGGLNPQVGDPAGGLDGSFGIDGIVEADFGGQLRACVVAADTSWIYVFAQRYRHPTDETRLVGARFAVATGTRDTGFGSAGTATLSLEEPGLEPSSLLLQRGVPGWVNMPPRPPRVLVALSRTTAGLDCDHLPTVAAVDATSGQQVDRVGYGGIALHSRVGPPALVEPDGAVVVTYRTGSEGPIQLRRIDAAGALAGLVDVPTSITGAEIRRLTALADGSLLVSGAGTSGWVAKLTAAGELDESFGKGGIAVPKRGPGTALVLGEREDGTIIVQVSLSGSVELCRLTARGEVMGDYGTVGFVAVRGFTHLLGAAPLWAGTRSFLDADGQVIVAATSGHDPGSGGSVLVALRRVTTDGTYDPKFGLGLPSGTPPPSDRRVELIAPAGGGGGNLDYSNFAAAGIARLDGALYLVGTAYSGGRKIWVGDTLITLPGYPVLIVTRWTRDGKVDTSWPGGFQEGGVEPTFLYWQAVGVQQESPTSMLVFGEGGTPVQLTSVLSDGTTNTTVGVRRPGPAVFRVRHPDGLDTSFGDDGAAVIRVPGFAPSVLAGGISNGDQATLAFLDPARLKRYGDPPRSTFGGAVRFA